MYHCSRHGIDHTSYDCPRCVEEEHHEELLSGLVEVARAQHELSRESEHKRANPGDFKCPHCLYVTLKREASRCPSCHGNIPLGYWDRVRTAEMARAEEWKRTAPQREAAARAEEERKKQTKLEEQKRKALNEGLWSLAIGVQWGFILGFFRGCSMHDHSLNWSTVFATVFMVSVAWGLVVYMYRLHFPKD